MKKVFAVLMVIAMVAGSVFAATSDTVNLRVDIDKVTPAFKLYYGTTGTGEIEITNQSLDDATNGITASFTVKQEGEEGGKDFSRWGTKGSGAIATLTVTCDKFYYYGTDAQSLSKDETIFSANPTISSAADKTKNGEAIENKLGYNAAPAITAATQSALAKVVFTPKYYGKKVNDQIVGYFEVNWPGNEELPYGIYKADITLSYGAL